MHKQRLHEEFLTTCGHSLASLYLLCNLASLFYSFQLKKHSNFTKPSSTVCFGKTTRPYKNIFTALLECVGYISFLSSFTAFIRKLILKLYISTDLMVFLLCTTKDKAIWKFGKLTVTYSNLKFLYASLFSVFLLKALKKIFKSIKRMRLQ